MLYCGSVVQLVRTLACHARGQGFDPPSSRHFNGLVAQSVEQETENLRVGGSIPPQATINVWLTEKMCWCSSIGRAADL